ncbi:hypothetical protein [Streptomyces sp. NPDC057428]|uniref:hypothetical protein n=1 Tax=Streptomyces sp. NPDC057428 TaxID=3346129 RepID=UPI00369CDA8A
MQPPTTRVPLLALSGGAGAGKSTLAGALAAASPDTSVIRLDRFFHVDPRSAPVVPAIKGPGVVVDHSDPASVRWDLVQKALADPGDGGGGLVVVEGTFALQPQVRALAWWTAYLDTPADLRLARKTLRGIQEGRDPEISVRGYLAHGRKAHDRHVAPLLHTADLVLDGTLPTSELVRRLIALISNACPRRG